MNALLLDLRCAIRNMVQRPGMALAVLLTLAVVIGANTAIFSVVETLLIHPLPYPDADRLVYLSQHNAQWGITTTPSAELIRACREQAESFEEIQTYSTYTFNVTGDGEPALLAGARVSQGFFPFLGVEPRLGRTFLPGEDRPGKDRVTVLSHGLWRSRFGADPGILGRDLLVNDEPFTIVGVLPATFRLEAYEEIRFWIPLTEEPAAAVDTEGTPLHSIARLAERVSVEAAQAEMEVISRRMSARTDEDLDVAWIGQVITPQDEVDSDLRMAILILQAAVTLVLLIACANIAHFLLAQGETRTKELAMRSALGASRGRLIRQLLTESVLLSLVGGTLGFLLASWGIDAIAALLPGDLDFHDRLVLRGSHLAFTLLVTLATGLVFGLLPALQLSLPGLGGVLKQSVTSSGAPERRRLMRQILVSTEVALSLLLLIGAGLLIKNFLGLQRIHPGFSVENLLTARLELPEDRYPEPAQQVAFFDELLDSLRNGSIPIETVSLTSGITSDFGAILARPEFEDRPESDGPRQLLIVVTAMPDHFKTLKIPILRGREFTDSDREDTEPVVIVSESLARRYLPGENPVGKKIRLGRNSFRLVGVAADIQLPALATQGLGGLRIYFPFRQRPTTAMTLVARTTAGSAAVIDTLKARIWSMDSHVPVTRIATAEDLLADSLGKQRFNALLMALLAGIAFLLSAVGVYGIVAFSVSRRTREIGIRLALGAGAHDVLRQVIWQGMRPVAIGVALGIAGAIAFARILQGLLHDVSVRDPMVFATMSLLVATIALFATWLPARRAARLDPMTVLRRE